MNPQNLIIPIMTYQKILLRLFSVGPMQRLGQPFLNERVWTIEEGEGAGLKLRFPQNRDYISGSSEIPVQKELARLLRPGDVFYDVGANVGFFSLIAARLVGSAGCVYSFEPVAENAASIRENARLNKLQNITLFDVAVGRTSGNAELLLTAWDGGSSLATSTVRPLEPLSKRNVRVVAMDDLVREQNLPLPDFVKIDVEGVELDVLLGMSGTIAKAKPILLYELDDGNKDSFQRRWRELDDYVSGFGYETIHLDESYPTLMWNVGHSLALPREGRKANHNQSQDA